MTERYHLAAPGLENLQRRDDPAPKPGPDEVVFRPRCVSLNARDLLVVRGYLPTAKLQVVPVSDGAGEVLAVGERVSALKPGDRVVCGYRPSWYDGPLEMAMLAWDMGGPVDGVLGQWALAPAKGVLKLPDNVSFEDAAALPCAGTTAWHALMGVAPLQSHETVLIEGTGGVSLFALAIARTRGCRVIATTSTAERAARLKALGADTVINRVETPDWDAEVLKATGGRGVDRIVEVGGPGALPKAMACIAPQGEITLVGVFDDPRAQVSPLPLMMRDARLRGVSAGSCAELAELLALVAKGEVRPVLDQTYSFERPAEAFERLASRQHIGKVLIAIP